MSVLGLMVLRILNKKKWEIFSHFFLFSTFILPQNGHFFKTSHFCVKTQRFCHHKIQQKCHHDFSFLTFSIIMLYEGGFYIGQKRSY